MSPFVQNHRRSLVILGLLIAATAFSAWSAYCPTIPPKPTTTPSTTFTTSTNAILAQPENTTRDTVDNSVQITTRTITTPSNTPPNIDTKFLEAKMTVGEKTYRLRFKTGDKLIAAMEILQAMSDQPFTLVTKEYAGMGKFVEAINGIKNDPAKNQYWGYYINGTSAPIGASSYILKEGDNIEWKYAKVNF